MSYTRFMETSTQICTRCNLDKPLDDYYLHKQGHRWKRCKDCVQEVATLNRKNNPEKTKEQLWRSNLKRKYSLTPDQFNDMVKAQGNACAICEETFHDRSSIHVDHDHSCCPGNFTCGKCIRKLLCFNCNSALGLLKDDIARILRAAAYLMEDE
jgi:hypothetical protein